MQSIKMIGRSKVLSALIRNKRVSGSKRKISFSISEEVKNALEKKQPIVALESTIITHGMPFPENVKCALEVEEAVRQQGAIPATIAIIHGKIKIGLSQEEINVLGDTKSSNPIKTSRRDLSYIVSNKGNGGTTVSATIIVATKAQIPIFATGGIGGVHRGAETTFDISADLTELGRSNIAVVSSGVKSILDIPKTLEYLETQGVFVATFGKTDDFPAFYSTKSGCRAPYCVRSIQEAAELIKTHKYLDLRSGMLFAVPIPEENAFDPDKVEGIIDKALREANTHGIRGKNITPYLLSQIAELTAGESLKSNIALIKNNARVAADIAVELATLEKNNQSNGGDISSRPTRHLEGRPVVIGGSNLDCSATLETSEIKLDGRIYEANFTYTAGGVARNICESLCKLGFPANFLTVIGADDQGRVIKSLIPQQSHHFVQIDNSYNTAQCTIVFDNKGSCKMLMGDMKIHSKITPQMILENEHMIKTSPVMIIDSNLSVQALEECLKMASNHNIPVLFEPTDVIPSTKPFRTSFWNSIKFITPNLEELREIARFLNIIPNQKFESHIEEVAFISKNLLNHGIDNIIATLGSKGVMITRRGLATDKLLSTNNPTAADYVRFYRTEPVRKLVNVSGAGDCFASGFVAALISNMSEEVCVSVGFAAAILALQSPAAVPKELFDRNHQSWRTSAAYENIL